MMLELLLKIIPMNLASTLSPGILAVSVLLLGGKRRPIIRVLSFLAGTVVVGTMAICAGFFLGTTAPSGIKPSLTSAAVDIIVAVIFIAFAIKILFTKEKINPSSKEHGLQLIKLFVAGIIVSGTNFDALFLSFAAAKEVGGTLGADDIFKTLMLFLNLLFFTLPTTLPLFIYTTFPKYAEGFFKTLNSFVLKYSRFIIAVLFIILGIVFLSRGAAYFY